MHFFLKKIPKNFVSSKNLRTFALPKREAQVAEW